MRDRDGYPALLRDLVGFPTVSADSNLALIDYAESFFEDRGWQTRRLCNADGTKANLLARIGPEVPGGIALAGHTDVVPVSGQAWQTDPFELVERDGNLYGRGTSDMKGFIALAMSAVAGIDGARLDKPVHVILTYDEEVGCLGAMALRETLAALPDRPRFVLIGEPTALQLVTAHKGIQSNVTRIHGKPGHSSYPAGGASAVACAARFIDGIAAALPGHEDPDFDPPTTTFNVGIVRGGEAVNIIPEWCELRWEFRHLPQQDAAEIHAALDAHAARVCRELPGTTLETRVFAGVPGLMPGANRDIVAELERIAAPPEPRVNAVPFVTEGGVFQEAGIPAVVCGPGRLDQAHQPNECVAISAMDTYEDFLAKAIARATTQ